ncbi:MAG: hypothetical protein MZV64_31560 [Ignavibacteriales bacterium]|nr:hypothetical protein [Ignavibacteriales bacterium]
MRVQQGEPENIRENYLIWDRPVQVSSDTELHGPQGPTAVRCCSGIPGRLECIRPCLLPVRQAVHTADLHGQ